MTTRARFSRSEAAPPSPEAPPESDGPVDRARALTKGAVVAATAVVALIAAVLGLVFDLWPGLRPDPRTQVGAEVSVIGIERKVTLGDFMHRTLGSEDAYRRWRADYVRENESAAGLAFHGQLVFVRVVARGFKGRDATLHWSIYDARTNARFRAPDEPERHETLQSFGAPTHEFVAELWTEGVFTPGRYFVRVELREGATLLAMSDSKPFAALRR